MSLQKSIAFPILSILPCKEDKSLSTFLKIKQTTLYINVLAYFVSGITMVKTFKGAHTSFRIHSSVVDFYQHLIIETKVTK